MTAAEPAAAPVSEYLPLSVPDGDLPAGLQPPATGFPVNRTAAVIFAETARHGGEARIVGGAVRDWLLGLPVREIDMATTLPPKTATSVLQAAGMKIIPTGISHGTITVTPAEKTTEEMIADSSYPLPTVELTTLRRDVRSDGRHAEVLFGTDWKADAERRDFTINALYLDARGRLTDPVGGLVDLAARRIRFIGEPVQRIREDGLRILRLFRFHAIYAATAPSHSLAAAGSADQRDFEDQLAAVRAEAAILDRLSGERLAKELAGLLKADAAAATLQLMEDCGLGEQLLAGPINAALLIQLLAWCAEADVAARLAAIICQRSATASGTARLSAIVSRLRLGQRLADRLAFLLAPIDTETIIGLLDDTYATGKTGKVTGSNAGTTWQYHAWSVLRGGDGGKRFTAADLAVRLHLSLFGDAALAPCLESPSVQAQLQNIASWVLPRFPLSGADLRAAGHAEGPALGKRLGQLEECWARGGFQASRKLLLERI